MRSPVERRADRLAAAVVEDDEWVIADLFDNLTRAQLREVALELAKRAGAGHTELGLMRSVVAQSARAFATTPEKILAGSRRTTVLEARMTACYAMRLLGCTYPAIGKHLGRDHSSVMNACARAGETPKLRHVGTAIALSLGWNREDTA